MTQLGEAVAIGMVDADETKCPFDHANPDPPTVKNQLIGAGGKLATKMKNGETTHLYPPLEGEQPKVPNPKDVSKHPFEGKKKAVVIKAKDEATGVIHLHQYPVTCAAHHLIPAQESLKVSRILAFMVKKGESGKLKDSSYTTGAVWANVGYEVNGVENGVYLPGSYAVGGGRGGLGLWTLNDDQPDSEEEDVADTPDPASPDLTGALNNISARNRKWRYVSQAMQLAPGQFHDRHEDYSRFVAEVLNKIFSDYKRQYKSSFAEQSCDQCKKNQDKLKELGIPTPMGLVGRLNTLASSLRVFLNGSAWRPNIYTSKWGGAFMTALKAKDPAAILGEFDKPV